VKLNAPHTRNSGYSLGERAEPYLPLNDGKTLMMVPDNSLDFVFSVDSPPQRC